MSALTLTEQKALTVSANYAVCHVWRFVTVRQTIQKYLLYKLMLDDSSVALKIETVCSVSVDVFCRSTVGSCFGDGRK